ncbi:MAG: hypothetical protein LC785_17390 [Acidobacteria bacterium]|nr:hypothetical protein [Acidobacteriota bacterium]
MKKALLLVGLAVFPLTCVYGFAMCVMVQAFGEGRPLDETLRHARPFCIGGLLSFAAFFACLITLIVSRKPKRQG